MDALGGLAGLIFTAQEGAPFFGIPFAGEQTTLRIGLKEDVCVHSIFTVPLLQFSNKFVEPCKNGNI